MRLRQGRITLELHELVRRDGPAVLLLHALFGSADDWRAVPSAWPGSVYALDCSGHGRSEWVTGGAYYPENLAAEVDAALQHIGRAALVGAGLGAYLALLVAGGRPDRVPAALLLPGAGLAGCGPLPDFDAEFPDLSMRLADEPATHRADPMVRLLAVYPRPVPYANAFAQAARRLLLAEDGTPRPPWWEGARQSATASTVPVELPAALASLMAAVGAGT